MLSRAEMARKFRGHILFDAKWCAHFCVNDRHRIITQKNKTIKMTVNPLRLVHQSYNPHWYILTPYQIVRFILQIPQCKLISSCKEGKALIFIFLIYSVFFFAYSLNVRKC